MENEDIEKLVNKLDEAINLLADIDLYNYGSVVIRKINQRKLNKSFEILFKTKKHLNYIKNTLEEGKQ